MTQGMVQSEADMPRMTLPQHLDELRIRVMRSVLALLAAAIVGFAFREEIWAFLLRPYHEALGVVGVKAEGLTAIELGEGFMQTMKVCFLTGLVAASPLVLWQMWGFIAAGLYDHERRTVRIFFPVSLVLFAMGLAAAYYILIPFGLRFLIGWDQGLEFAAGYRIADYLSTCLKMVFAMGFLFELPLLMVFVQATDLVSRETLKSGWKWAVILALVFGSLFTDPSPVTQVLMAVPVVGLYMLGLWGGRYFGLGRRRFRWWDAWPLVIGLVAYVLMIVFAQDINNWAASTFGDSNRPTPATTPVDALPTEGGAVPN